MKFTTEPSADIREAASALRQLYVGLVNEGFEPAEALNLVGCALRANTERG